MLPRATDRVAEVIRIANRIAREYDQEYVGTEHLLLAVQREGSGKGAAILKKHGITADKLRDEVDKLVKKQMEETWVFGRLPGTPHFKNVMAAAIEQCRRLKAHEVCTEHLLLGLLLERGSVACNALKNLGLSATTVRDDIQRIGSAT